LVHLIALPSAVQSKAALIFVANVMFVICFNKMTEDWIQFLEFPRAPDPAKAAEVPMEGLDW